MMRKNLKLRPIKRKTGKKTQLTKVKSRGFIIKGGALGKLNSCPPALTINRKVYLIKKSFFSNLLKPVALLLKMFRVVAKHRLPAKFTCLERGDRWLDFGE